MLAVLATLAFVFVLEKLLVMVPRPYQAQVKRSDALLAAEEQRSQMYQDYYESVRADQKRYQALLSRWEQEDERFEKILSRWEEQQKAYQTYLDSLKHP
jgi:hypothetical protein